MKNAGASSLRETNEQLKKQLDDLTAKTAAAPNAMEQKTFETIEKEYEVIVGKVKGYSDSFSLIQ